MSFTIPYAPRRQYEPNTTIADLIQRGGAQRADSIRRGGEISANMYGSLGQIASGAFQQYQAQKAEKAKIAADAPRLADEARMRDVNIRRSEAELKEQEAEALKSQALSEIFSSDRPDPKAIIQVMGPERGMRIVSGLSALQPDSEKQYRDQSTLLRDAISGVGAVPEPLRADAWKLARQNLLSRGLISPDMAAEEYSPAEFARVSGFGRAPEAPKAQEPFSLSPGQVRYGPDGKMIASVPREPKEPKDPTYREINGQTYIMQGTKAIPVNVPGAAVANTPDEAPFVAQPGYQKLPPAGKTAVTSMNNLIQDAKAYRQKLDELVGSSGINLTGEDAALLNSMHAGLLFTAAKAYEQGALQAPDKAVVEQIFPNPAKWSSAVGTLSRGGKAGQLSAIDNLISDFEKRMQRTWGLKPSTEAPLDLGTTVPGPAQPKKKPRFVNGAWERN